MARDDLAELEGTVTHVHAGGQFSVELENGQKVTAKLSGRMRKFHIRVLEGDHVTLGVSPYDPTHGLITYRHKDKGFPKGGTGPKSGPKGGGSKGGGPKGGGKKK